MLTFETKMTLIVHVFITWLKVLFVGTIIYWYKCWMKKQNQWIFFCGKREFKWCNKNNLLIFFQIKGEAFVLTGKKPGEAIIEAVEVHKADLVICGTRGLGKIRRTFLGSVSDYVVQHARCPVVVVRKDWWSIN